MLRPLIIPDDEEIDMTRRENFFVGLFNSILFGTVFTFVGPLVSGQSIDWGSIPIQLLVGTVVGLAVSLTIPAGKWGGILAGKVAKPGNLLFKFIMYSVILVIMLIFMCPILTVFIACILGGAPVAAVLPTSYSLFVPFYVIGILVLLVVGDIVTNAAIKCAHLGRK